MKIKKAVIPAAGFGTRFLPATKSVPKEMMPIVDKPAIQYVVEEAVSAGIEDILIITSSYKKAVEDYFDTEYELNMQLKAKGKTDIVEQLDSITELANIHFIRQKGAKGLGHAVGCAKAFVGNEPFAIILPDDLIYNSKPCMKQMVEQFEKYEQSIIGVQRVDKNEVNKYGIISGEKLTENVYKIDGMVEKPDVDKAPTNIAIVGRYIVTPEIFDILENVHAGKGGEIQLTDGLLKLSEVQDLYAYIFEGKRYDVGNTKGYLEAVVEYALRRDDIKDDFKKHIISLIEK